MKWETKQFQFLHQFACFVAMCDSSHKAIVCEWMTNVLSKCQNSYFCNENFYGKPALTNWMIPHTDRMRPHSDNFGPQICILFSLLLVGSRLQIGNSQNSLFCCNHCCVEIEFGVCVRGAAVSSFFFFSLLFDHKIHSYYMHCVYFFFPFSIFSRQMLVSIMWQLFICLDRVSTAEHLCRHLFCLWAIRMKLTQWKITKPSFELWIVKQAKKINFFSIN